MAADALAPYPARPAAMVQIKENFLVFLEEGFQWPVKSQCQEMIENANMMFSIVKEKKNSMYSR